MTPHPSRHFDDYDDPESPRGPYDCAEEVAEADLWFVRPDPADAAWEMPGPRADRVLTPDPAAWVQAERAQPRVLARAASELARLDERLRDAPGGHGLRLALEEAEALGRPPEPERCLHSSVCTARRRMPWAIWRGVPRARN